MAVVYRLLRYETDAAKETKSRFVQVKENF
jgi:hypothetical protein